MLENYNLSFQSTESNLPCAQQRTNDERFLPAFSTATGIA